MMKMYKTVGPASYATGGFTFNATDFKKVNYVIIASDGGYKAEVASVSGNQITVKVLYYNYPGTAAGVAEEIPAATDLSGVTFYLMVDGL